MKLDEYPHHSENIIPYSKITFSNVEQIDWV